MNGDSGNMKLRETVCNGCSEVERAFLNGEVNSVATTTADHVLRQGLAACRGHVESVMRNVGEMDQDINDVMDGWSERFFEVLRLLCFSPGCVSLSLWSCSFERASREKYESFQYVMMGVQENGWSLAGVREGYAQGGVCSAASGVLQSV